MGDSVFGGKGDYKSSNTGGSQKRRNINLPNIENNHYAMEKNIRQDGNFKKVYEDDEATIYKVL